MPSGGPRAVRIALAALSVPMAAAAFAWACTPAARVTIDTAIGGPGTTVTLSGSQFEENETVRIAWGGAGGQPLTQATTSSSGSFTAAVTVPNAPAGTYTIAATGSAGYSVASFTIVGREQRQEEGSPAPAPAPAGRPSAPARAPEAPGSASGTTSGAETGGGATSAARAVTRGGWQGATRSARDQGEAGGVTTLRSGTAVFADSVPSRAQGGVRTKAEVSERSAKVPAAAAAGDLWSGFRSEKASGVLGVSSGQVQDRSPVPFLSLALAGLGLLTVLAGVGVAGMRRRRSYAGRASG